MFIVFEGIDKSGKTTQSKRLVDSLNKMGHKSIWTCEPNNQNDFCKTIRSLFLSNNDLSPMEEVLLLTLSRVYNFRTNIFPALEKGINVICDRWTDSMMVYQCYAGDCHPNQAETIIHEVVYHSFPKGTSDEYIDYRNAHPDYYFLLDADLKTYKDRVKQCHAVEKNRFELKSDKYMQDVIDGFKEVMAHYANEEKVERIESTSGVNIREKIKRIDASLDKKEISDIVLNKVVSLLRQ